MALTTVRGVSVGGIVKPLRVSRSRAPATGTSTVTIKGVEPRLRGPLDERHRPVAVLPHVELEPLPAASGAAAATSSIDVVPMVESV